MSEWHEIKFEDMEIDMKEKELYIFIHQNDFGAVYASITFGQIEEMYKAIQQEKP